MARNLLAEHRISQDRFNSFLKFAGELKSIDAVHDALDQYQKHVRPLRTTKLLPAYQLPENATNVIELPDDTEIATVLDLTRLGRVFAEAKSAFKYPEFSDYRTTNPRDYAQINEFLGRHFNDPARRVTLMHAILRARKQYRATTEKWIHPTWVAEWQSLVPYLRGSGPLGWLQAVGVPIEEARWVAALRYRVSTSKRTIRLFRPTQLDIGWYAHHFPSPPTTVLDQGGHAMYLLSGTSSGAIAPAVPGAFVREYLHEAIDYEPEDWEFAEKQVRARRADRRGPCRTAEGTLGSATGSVLAQTDTRLDGRMYVKLYTVYVM